MPRCSTAERLDLYWPGASLFRSPAKFPVLRVAAQRDFRETAAFAILTNLFRIQT
jgi:hypothetical protein